MILKAMQIIQIMPLLVQGMVGLSLMSYCKITKDGITDRCMVMIRFLWTGVYQPVPVPARTGPDGLAPPIAQEGRLPFTYVTLLGNYRWYN